MASTKQPRLLSDVGNAIREHEFNKYLQLLPHRDNQLGAVNVAHSTAASPQFDTLRDALNTHVELVIARLKVQAAFVVLTYGEIQHLLAGCKWPQASDDDDAQTENANWLRAIDADLSIWRSIFQRTISLNESPMPAQDTIFSVTSTGDDDAFHRLSTVARVPTLGFYAGTPITSRHGINVGIVFVVDGLTRKGLAAKESKLLTTTSKKCMQLLEFARERGLRDRWTLMSFQLDRFARPYNNVLTETPDGSAALKVEIQPKLEKIEVRHVSDIAHQFRTASHAVDDLLSLQNDLGKDSESTRLLEAEAARDVRLLQEEQERNARSLEGCSKVKEKPRNSKGETTYRKTFQRAAECLQAGLQVDGAMFCDGIVGFHGSIQPVAEPEQELEHESKKRLFRNSGDSGATSCKFRSWERQGRDKEHNESTSAPQPWVRGEATRVFTSPEYLRGVYVDRPAEILGIHTRERELKPLTTKISESTLGMVEVNEGHLQRLMDRYPEGNVWYFPECTNAIYPVKDDTPTKIDSQEEVRRLSSSFPGMKQLIFRPLNDPVSLKRLAGCFIWSMQTWPILTDSVDFSALQGFLHLVQAEICRIDTYAAMKQKETFVSSISHELRTPLHGILGAVQLFGDTGLDNFQTMLISTIKSCGSTLHETLSSVLSYAKINQFERRQVQSRQGRPLRSKWALTDKEGMAAGPDRDFEGLYMTVNIAMLCEEIVRMLESGLLFSASKDDYRTMVILNIRYEDNWCFYTEPGALRRIAANVIGNALKYTSQGSVTVTLATSQELEDKRSSNMDRASGRMVNLTVTDTGRGMSRDFLEHHLFVPFTQENATTSEGVGLGMSIVKSLVSLLSGEILVKSIAGKGTEIRVSMPMRRNTEDQDEPEQPAAKFAHDISYLRSICLSVIVLGFPSPVHDSMKIYLLEWFQCTVMDIEDDRDPDIIIIEEGNADAKAAIEKEAPRYGHQSVLLSIVMDPARLGKRMKEIEGYPQCERLLRPLGPRYLSRALISCVNKLKYLRKLEIPPKSEEILQEEEAKGKDIRQNNGRSTDKDHIQESPSPNEGVKSLFQQDNIGDVTWDDHLTNRRSELRVLIVDDNTLNMRLLGAFLQKYGCRNIQKAENGAVAVEAVKNHVDCFDIIFMDLTMPIMDGFEATREIRTMEKERSVAAQTIKAPMPAVVVALTGLGSSHDEESAYAAGVDFFITKPVQFASMEYLLRQFEDGSLQR
ncbi:hypothetical protein FB567DRAFT_612160 [Paraphoma chrysanthemicola]|uniref:Histidine kinase n=1 Tax=Paraphoma chrysanthemicola TaxID=798071 RepID=A0A8K0VT28_9PLEO|nr:hypothetical protein FB567DRAFT_612160 [Paraphoma chrysanthemicola]